MYKASSAQFYYSDQQSQDFFWGSFAAFATFGFCLVLRELIFAQVPESSAEDCDDFLSFPLYSRFPSFSMSEPRKLKPKKKPILVDQGTMTDGSLLLTGTGIGVFDKSLLPSPSTPVKGCISSCACACCVPASSSSSCATTSPDRVAEIPDSPVPESSSPRDDSCDVSTSPSSASSISSSSFSVDPTENKGMDELDSYIDRLTSLQNDPEWQVLKEAKDGMKVFKKVMDGTSTVMFRVEMPVPVSPSVIAQHVLDTNLLLQWSKQTKEVKPVGLIEGWNCFVSVFKTPIGVANREMVERRAERVDSERGAHFIVFTSNKTTEVDIPQSKGTVRGFTYLTGYVIRSIPSAPSETGEWTGAPHAHVSFFAHGSPGGNIPTSLINSFGSSATMDLCVSLKEACVRFAKSQGK